MNRLLALSPAERERGVIAASSGNHGAAVAWAASALGIAATVYVPQKASPAKVEKIRSRGAQVVFFGVDGLDTEIEARAASARSQAVYVSPYNDDAVVAGQGTVGLEFEQQVRDLDRLYVAVGGGGLIGGIAAWYAHASPATRIVGALPENSPVMAESVRAGRIVEMPSLHTLSDGTAGGIEPGSITFPLCQSTVHEWVTVSEAEIVAAMRLWARDDADPIEGAAAVAIAALQRDRGRVTGARCGVVVCGGNVLAEQWLDVVKTPLPSTG
jgi:threonine dehydratase